MTTPARALRMSHRSLTGRVALRDGDTATFESSLERDWLIALDFDPSVVQIQVQPFTLTYLHGGRSRRYTPDVAATLRGPVGRRNAVVVYEVKPYEDLRDHWTEFRPRFQAAVRHCRSQGWLFKIVTEKHIRTPFLENATFLRRYRAIPDQPLVRMQLLYTLQALGTTTPQALLAAAYPCPTARAGALATLWSLVATRRVGAALDQPLTMASAIWAGSA